MRFTFGRDRSRQVLDEQERRSVLVTELLRTATDPDGATRSAARLLLKQMEERRELNADDSGVVHVVLAAQQ